MRTRKSELSSRLSRPDGFTCAIVARGGGTLSNLLSGRTAVVQDGSPAEAAFCLSGENFGAEKTCEQCASIEI